MMKNRLRKRYKDVGEALEKYENMERDKNDWEEGHFAGLLGEHEFLWHILEWYKVDLEDPDEKV